MPGGLFTLVAAFILFCFEWLILLLFNADILKGSQTLMQRSVYFNRRHIDYVGIK